MNRNISTKRSRVAIELPKDRTRGGNVTLWFKNYIACEKGILSWSTCEPINSLCRRIAEFRSSRYTVWQEFARSYIVERLNSYLRDPTISSGPKPNPLSSAPFTPLFPEPSVPISQDFARKQVTVPQPELYTLFRPTSCGLNSAANLPHNVVRLTGGTIPLVVGLPTLQASFIDFEFGR